MLFFLCSNRSFKDGLYSQESERHSALVFFQMKACTHLCLFMWFFFNLLALINEYIYKLCSVALDSIDIFCLQVKQVFQDMTI